MSKTTNLSALSDVVSVDGNGKVVAPGFKGTSYYHSATGQPDWYTANYLGDFYINGNGGDRLKIDSAGRVTMPYQPAFLAYASPSYTGSPRYVYSFGIVDHNVGNHYDNSTGRFTAPVAGTYCFNLSIWAQTGNNGFALFSVNGVQKNGTHVYADAGADGVSASTVFSLQAGDWVRIELETIAIQGSTPRNSFSGYLLG